VADTNQNTGRRVNLPMPADCGAFASECEDVSVLNQLDGFNMMARIAMHSRKVDRTPVCRACSGHERVHHENSRRWRQLRGSPIHCAAAAEVGRSDCRGNQRQEA
jgi:hypothetical protein